MAYDLCPWATTSVTGEAELTQAQRRRLAVAGGGIEDWDLPFAYEAIARAEAVAGSTAESARHELMTREAGEGIADDEDRDHLLSELGTLPGR
jgi:hypothetical protein